MNYAPGKDLERGAVGYFPEGTFYGPQQDTAVSVTLVLQIGGASGYGFMSYDQLNAGYQQLCDYGNFERGVFARTTADGRTIRKDGYEAVWEHVMRRDVRYPAPRFDEPVVMFSDNFNWMGPGGGIEVKRLGAFGERGLELSFVRGARGARHVIPELATCELLFVVNGALRASACDQPIDAHSALRVEAADSGMTLEVVEEALMFAIRMPLFS